MSARVAVRQHSSSSLTSYSILSRSLPPVPPPVVPPIDCNRDKDEEIYITSASVIELESRKSTDNDSYDSGIYNNSTNTGWSSSSSSDKIIRQKQSSTFLKMVCADNDGVTDYEEQIISVWLDLQNDDYSSEDDEESVYETLSDSATARIEASLGDEEEDDKQEDFNLTKIAEVAGKGLKKLRRNWSIKKDDLSKGLSKIKRSSKNLIEDVYTKDAKFSSVGRRKLSMTQLLTSVDQSQASSCSSFYVGLSDSASSINNKSDRFSRSGSVLSDIHESGIITDFSPPLSISSSGASYHPSLSPSSMSSSVASAPIRPRRRSGKSRGSVTRPSDPPPPPPINLETHPLNKSELDPSEDSNCKITTLDSEYHEAEQIYFSRLMPNEPLYQFYETLPSQDSSKMICDDFKEAVNNNAKTTTTTTTSNSGEVLGGHGQAVPCQTRFSAECMSSSVVSQSGQRSLWCDMPQVKSSTLLSSISPEVRRCQEAKFEIISSEASYLKSLNVLVSQFANSTKLRHNNSVISQEEWSHVFSNIYQIRECSEKFLQSLETCWQRSIMMHGLSEIILAASRTEFDVFIDYCSNQAVQEKTLKKLKNVNSNFAMVLQDLESSQVCQSLSLHSFLMLPMQRITRLPLLTAAILSHCGAISDQDQENNLVFSEKETFQKCLETLNDLVTRCNEGARHRERQDQLVKISNNLDFKQVPWLYLVTGSRWLVTQVSVTRLCWRESNDKITWGRKLSKMRLQLLLFTDLLLVCKKKRDEKLAVLDYCQRNMLDLSEVELTSGASSLGMGAIINSSLGMGGVSGSAPAWLTLIQNSGKKTCEMIIIFDSVQERSNWIELIAPTQDGGEKIYESWDCPSVQIQCDHYPQSEGELEVQCGEIARVLRKSDEGKLFIERSEDGLCGWIPANITKELQSDHMRARNFKQRYQFLKALAELDMAET